jgi:hypothetical protein
MDLFRKGIRAIPAPVHVLVALTDTPSSVFLYHLLQSRLNTSLTGQTAVCRKLEAVRPVDLEHFTLLTITQWAKGHDFNCVVLADDANQIALASFAVISCGRTDLLHRISTDDPDHFGIAVLRPVRQCLKIETQLYCDTENLTFCREDSIFERAFKHEKAMIDAVLADGHGGTPFAIQKMAERVTPSVSQFNCPECGFPAKSSDVCEICQAIGRVQ